MLLDQLVETPYSDVGQLIHGTRAVDRHADQVLALGDVEGPERVLQENRTPPSSGYKIFRHGIAGKISLRFLWKCLYALQMETNGIFGIDLEGCFLVRFFCSSRKQPLISSRFLSCFLRNGSLKRLHNPGLFFAAYRP